MKTLFFLSVLFLMNGSLLFALSGTAQLNGQSNHAGIKIKFIANSGTALSDSTVTDAAGNYSLNIAGGVYQIVYTKTGYQTYMYNDGTALAIPNSTVLALVDLLPGSAFYVSGNVSGQWQTNATYVVIGDLTVPGGSTLSIGPGTTVKVMGNYSIVANGAFQAKGSALKPISIFAGDTTKPWANLELRGGPNVLDYCILRKYNRIESWQVQTTITHCLLYGCNTGVLVYGGNALIENNVIVNAEVAGISGGAQAFASTATISCNRISSPKYLYSSGINKGIHITGSEVVRENEISDCQHGIWVYALSQQPAIERNYIHHNRYGGLVLDDNTFSLTVNNNTFHNNHTGIFCQNPDVIVTNNAITSCSVGMSGTCQSFDHNLIFSCTNTFSMTSPPVGIGQTVTVNSNGDPIDSYFNLFIDPLYTTKIPAVQPGSPLLNAGNTTYDNHIGVQNFASGCAIVGFTNSVPEYEQPGIVIYPNPSDGLFVIKSDEVSEIVVTNNMGQTVLRSALSPGESYIDLTAVSDGIYFCILRSGQKSRVVKLVKN